MIPSSLTQICVARRILCASPHESVFALRARVIYERPTPVRKSSLSHMFFNTFSLIFFSSAESDMSEKNWSESLTFIFVTCPICFHQRNTLRGSGESLYQ